MRVNKRLTIAAVALAGGLFGCAGQRPIEMVRADANDLFFEGQYGDAQPLYEEVVDRRNANAKAHYELGRNLLALDRASEAREQMVLAYNLEPSEMTYFDGLADSYVAAGDEAALFSSLEHQIRDRGGVDDYMRLGRYAQRLGHADEAERAYLGAAEIDGGESAGPQRALAEFYRSIGDAENEVRRLRMVMWFDPSDNEIEQRLRELGEVPGPSFVLEPTGRD
jgi:tetratricopeptide (TPR) repeat protein